MDKTSPKVIAVVGSVGKTSTTQAVADTLRSRYRVTATKGSYNTDLGVVMSVFDESIQTSRAAWVLCVSKIIIKSIFTRPKSEIYVLELSPDTPNGMRGHAYIKPDITVVTAITPEHMEFYSDLDAVAAEELAVNDFSRELIINIDMVSEDYIDGLVTQPYQTYGLAHAVFTAQGEAFEKGSRKINFFGGEPVSVSLPLLGDHSIYLALAAYAVGSKLGMSASELQAGLSAITASPGRMQLLNGIQDSLILDDTYNASPEAYKAALHTLQQLEAQQKIVVFGSMNELGKDSKKYHEQVASWADPRYVNHAVTLGHDAGTYIAPMLRIKGIDVHEAASPVEVASLVKKFLKPGAAILIKGSQNGVFAEEVTKRLLANPADVGKLVRQTGYWPAKKAKQFPDLLQN